MKKRIIPFLWLRGETKEKIVNEIEQIYQSGIRAFCVESRPHPDFMGKLWWRDMDIIMSEARSRGMQVMVLDDAHYPTGYANGAVKANPQYRQRFIRCDCVDVIGGARYGKILQTAEDGDELLGCFAYALTERGLLPESVVDLTGNVKNGYVYFELSERLYRIVSIYKTFKGAEREYYIDTINADSVNLLIQEVYEPHYQRYKEDFGKTFIGFFSDEPRLGNAPFSHLPFLTKGCYNNVTEDPNNCYTYSDRILLSLQSEIQDFHVSDLTGLWFDLGERSRILRYKYMNAVTALYSECFSVQIGKWCKEHGVEYIGHVIEDMSAHMHFGCSIGHYFRSQRGQTMAGVDIVLHQVKPYSNDVSMVAPIEGGFASPAFFNYTLPKLAVSCAALNERMHGNSVCEIFGAFGWAEGVEEMKWMTDLMLVRGVNHFVPHAFSATFPNEDCPPHFFGDGKNPQYKGFCRLMGYMNEMCELFSGGEAVVQCAVFYPAEADWVHTSSECLLDKILKKLLDSQVDADIISFDDIDKAERYRCLVVPYSKYYPANVIARLKSLSVPVVFVSGKDEDRERREVELYTLDCLPEVLQRYIIEKDISLLNEQADLQYRHYLKDGEETWMLFNAGAKTLKNVLYLNRVGNYLTENKLTGYSYVSAAEKGIPIELEGGESVVIRKSDGNAKITVIAKENLRLNWEISLIDAMTGFRVFCKETQDLFDVNTYDKLADFSGTVCYKTTFSAKKGKYMLDFGWVGGTISIRLNGIQFEERIAKPYRYDISDVIVDGQNQLEVEVRSTLANRLKDNLSTFSAIPSTGIQEVKLFKYQ